MRRTISNTLIGALLFALVVDALPSLFPGHRRLDAMLDDVLDVTGLWQGNWQLFAPDVDRINTYVEAVVVYADGSTWSWTTPDWRDRSWWETLHQSRHPKLADNLRRDEYSEVWPSLARHVLRQAPRPEDAVRVDLYRWWWDVPPPGERSGSHPWTPPPREAFEHRFLFHREAL